MKKLNSIWRNLNLPVYKNEFLVFARFELLYKKSYIILYLQFKIPMKFMFLI